jgi:pimeloyl-ACP methyl ester carboxylesterase
MAEDLYSFFNRHGIQKAHLIGHSMGGKVAMHFAQTHPELLNKMVVADMGIKAYPMHHQHILAGIHALDLPNIRSRSEAEKILSLQVEAAGVRQFLLKNLYWVTAGQLGWRMNVAVLEREMPCILAALPEEVSWTPTLFLRGELSNYILSEDENSLEELFPDSILQTIPNAGHWLHAEQPDTFFDAVMGFCLR